MIELRKIILPIQCHARDRNNSNNNG